MTTREAYSKEEYERLERDIVGHSTISPSEASVLRAALRIASRVTPEFINAVQVDKYKIEDLVMPDELDAILRALKGEQP